MRTVGGAAGAAAEAPSGVGTGGGRARCGTIVFSLAAMIFAAVSAGHDPRDVAPKWNQKIGSHLNSR